jgi:hypothetical protein
MTQERFLAALTRNALLAAVPGALFYLFLPREVEAWWSFIDAYTLAFCFTFLGWVLEELLLMIPGIEEGAGRLVRLAGWFGGGLWIYEIGRRLWLAYGRDTLDLPALAWGGVFTVAMQLGAHAWLRARGRPNYFDGGQVGS